MDKIDRRIIKSKQAIESVFLQMVVKDGFDKITVTDIVTQANVGRKTFYLHYSDKFDLLDQILDDHIAQLTKLCAQKKNLGMMEGAILWFSYFEQHKLLFASWFRSKSAGTFRERLLSFTMGEINQKIDVDSNSMIDKSIFLRFLSTATVGVLESYVLGEIEHDIESIAKQLLQLYVINIRSTFSDQNKAII